VTDGTASGPHQTMVLLPAMTRLHGGISIQAQGEHAIFRGPTIGWALSACGHLLKSGARELFAQLLLAPAVDCGIELLASWVPGREEGAAAHASRRL